MSTSEGLAAPASGTDDIPDFATLAADPEIAPLLDFEPVVRQLQKTNGWNAGMQRMFIAWLAHYGSPGKAAEELGKARSGIDKVYRAAGADSFRAAWDGAVDLAMIGLPPGPALGHHRGDPPGRRALTRGGTVPRPGRSRLSLKWRNCSGSRCDP